MIKLYGFPISNYYNIAKAALLEAGAEFEDVRTVPSQKDDYLAISPMGKVPAMEVDGACLTEASVMVDYVAENLGGSLYPADPVAKAQVRELMRYVDLYIDLAARPCFGEALFGGTVPTRPRRSRGPISSRGSLHSGGAPGSTPTSRGPRSATPTSSRTSRSRSPTWWRSASSSGTSWRTGRNSRP